MLDLIKELENNKKINEEKGLENVVNIDYILKRLKDICILEEFLKGEINFNIETLMNDDYLEQEQKDKLLNFKDKDIKEIINEMEKVNYLWEEINENIQFFLNRKIYKESRD